MTGRKPAAMTQAEINLRAILGIGREVMARYDAGPPLASGADADWWRAGMLGSMAGVLRALLDDADPDGGAR